jgi:holo-[acyl-carrier protein] synthase
MKFIGMGIDITRQSRIQHLLTKDTNRFIRKCLHPKEIVEFYSKDVTDRIRFVSVRWAIKESLYKALTEKIVFNEIYVYKVNRKPRIDLNDYECMVTVSHDGDLVVASCIAFKE